MGKSKRHYTGAAARGARASGAASGAAASGAATSGAAARRGHIPEAPKYRRAGAGGTPSVYDSGAAPVRLPITSKAKAKKAARGTVGAVARGAASPVARNLGAVRGSVGAQPRLSAEQRRFARALIRLAGSEGSAARVADSPAAPKRLRRRSPRPSEGMTALSISSEDEPLPEAGVLSSEDEPLPEAGASSENEPLPEAGVSSEDDPLLEAGPEKSIVSKTFIYRPSQDARLHNEYIDASERMRLKVLLSIDTQQAEVLVGHDTADLFLSWPQSDVAASGAANTKPRHPAHAAAHAILGFHKVKKNEFRDADNIRCVATESVFPMRGSTSNWSLRFGRQPAAPNQSGEAVLRSPMSLLERQKEEIDAALRHHDGEARVWQVEPEVWEPLEDPAILDGGLEGMGAYLSSTEVPQTAAARGAIFAKAKREIDNHISVVDFGTRYMLRRPSLDYAVEYDDYVLGPDFDNAVSTLVLRSKTRIGHSAAPSTYWLRRVRVITLAEVIAYYKHDVEFDNLYDTWLEGEIVFLARAKRGTSGGGRSRKLAAT